MKLVPENINEAIKHLTPKSPEEIIESLENLSNEALFRMWPQEFTCDADDITPIDKAVIKELIKRNASEMDDIKSQKWYEMHKDEINESIKHLTPRSLEEIIKQIKDYDSDDKASYLRDMQRHYPNLFKNFKESENLDDETNQLLLFMQIKSSLDENNTDEVKKLITHLAKKYGKKNIVDSAKELNIFTGAELSQLKLSLYNKTRNRHEKFVDEYWNLYAFIGYEEDVEVKIKGKKYFKKELGIENLIKIDKYNSASVMQIPIMKQRAQIQYGGTGTSGNTYGIYVSKDWLDGDSYQKRDLPDYVFKYIDENKFKV